MFASSGGFRGREVKFTDGDLEKYDVFKEEKIGGVNVPKELKASLTAVNNVLNGKHELDQSQKNPYFSVDNPKTDKDVYKEVVENVAKTKITLRDIPLQSLEDSSKEIIKDSSRYTLDIYNTIYGKDVSNLLEFHGIDEKLIGLIAKMPMFETTQTKHGWNHRLLSVDEITKEILDKAYQKAPQMDEYYEKEQKYGNGIEI